MTLGSHRFSWRAMRALALSIVLAGASLALAAPRARRACSRSATRTPPSAARSRSGARNGGSSTRSAAATAPAAFKGWVNELSRDGSGCPRTWTTDPGNSSEPPEGPLPGLIEVLVPSAVTKSGRIISGDSTEVVLVRTEPGLRPESRATPGTGTVVGGPLQAGNATAGRRTQTARRRRKRRRTKSSPDACPAGAAGYRTAPPPFPPRLVSESSRELYPRVILGREHVGRPRELENGDPMNPSPTLSPRADGPRAPERSPDPRIADRFRRPPARARPRARADRAPTGR